MRLRHGNLVRRAVVNNPLRRGRSTALEGGSAHDRRKLYRAVRREMEKHGTHPIVTPAEAKEAALIAAADPPFSHKAELVWAIISIFFPLGYQEVIAAYDLSPLLRASLGWVLWSIPFGLGCHVVWRWLAYKKWRKLYRVPLITACSLGFLGTATQSIRSAAKTSYVYLIATKQLLNGNRAFILGHSGRRVLNNVDVAMWDNKSGSGHSEHYPEIDPGEQNPLSPKFFWWKPRTPGDEDYGTTITSREGSFNQEIIIRAVNGSPRFAVELTIAGTKKELINCADPELTGLAGPWTRKSRPCTFAPSQADVKLPPPQEPPPPPKAYVEFGNPAAVYPEVFRENAAIGFNIDFTNFSSLPTRSHGAIGKVYLRPDRSATTQKDIAQKFHKFAEAARPSPATPLMVPGSVEHFGASGPVLTTGEIQKIKSGKDVVFVIGALRYEPRLGSKTAERHMCRYLQPETASYALIWHFCDFGND